MTDLDVAGPSKIFSDPKELTVLPAPKPRPWPWKVALGAVVALAFAAVGAMYLRARRLAAEAGEIPTGPTDAENEELRRVRQMRLSGEAGGFFSAAEKLADLHLARALGGRPREGDGAPLDARAREAVDRLLAACGQAKYNPSVRSRDLMESVEGWLETILSIPVSTQDDKTRQPRRKENAT